MGGLVEKVAIVSKSNKACYIMQSQEPTRKVKNMNILWNNFDEVYTHC